MTMDTVAPAAPSQQALTVHALRSGPDTRVRLTGHLMDSDLRLLDETIEWLLDCGARHIVVDTRELAGDTAVLADWIGGYRQQCLVNRHVLSMRVPRRTRRTRV